MQYVPRCCSAARGAVESKPFATTRLLVAKSGVVGRVTGHVMRAGGTLEVVREKCEVQKLEAEDAYKRPP